MHPYDMDFDSDDEDFNHFNPLDLCRITLNSKRDWKPWITAIERFATLTNVWIYLDPENPSKPTLTPPKWPECSDVKPGATCASELTPGEFVKLERLVDHYGWELSKFHRCQRALLHVLLFVMRTEGRYNFVTACEPDLPRQLELLRDHLRLTEWDLLMEERLAASRASKPRRRKRKPKLHG